MASRSPATAEAGAAPPALATRIRTWRRTAGIALVLATHLPLHGLWRLFGLTSPWPRSFLRLAGWCAGARVTTVGTPVQRDVLYAANHIGFLDILVLAGVSGARFVSKDDVARWPGVGFLADLNRTVYIARAARGRVAEQADMLRAALAEHVPVALFPEGGTGDGRHLKPFRASLLAALVPPLPGVRLQPVVIDYGADAPIIAWGDDRGFFPEMARLLGKRGRRRVTIRFLDPIDPVNMPDRKRLAAEAYAAIAGALGDRGGAPL